MIYDTAGHERFRTITTSYYRGAHAIVIVFDVTERQSFEHVEKWLGEINKFAKENVLIFLVGNKIDLNDKRVVTFEEAKGISERYKIQYFETSAKNNTNVEQMFVESTEIYLKKIYYVQQD